jgi:UTP--glucose-1-phosphate uridylyltransferase
VKAIIPAAGLGTRFLPATKSTPKEMLPVVDKPCIQYVIEECVAGGAEEILVVTGRNKRALEDHFDRAVELENLLAENGKSALLEKVQDATDLAQVFYVRQGEPLGLGHAVHCGAPFTADEPFYVLLGDVLVPEGEVLPRMRAVYERTGASVIAVQEVAPEDVGSYGVIAGERVEPGVWRVTGLVEKPAPGTAPSNLAIFGRYLLTPAVMELLPRVEPGAGGEIQLTDALSALLEREEMYAVVVDDGEGFDTGNVLMWLEANVALAMRRPEYRDDLRRGLRRIFGE